MQTLTRLLRIPAGAFSRVAVIVVLSLTVAIAISESPRPAAAPLSAGLSASVDGTYDVRPDEGVAYAQWTATLNNTGPSPWRPADDPENNPSEIEILIPAGFTDFQVSSPGGAPYGVVWEDLGYASIAHVQLGYSMPFGDTVSLHYTFTVNSSTDSGILIRPTYVYIDAFAGVQADSYAAATLSIILPAEYAENAVSEWGQCVAANHGETTTLSCLSPYADLEIIDEDSRLSVTKDLDVNGRNVDLVLRYWQGDEAWAQRAEELVTQALPIFAELFGAPYAGPSTIRLSEKGGSEIYGARGVAYCQNTICALAATPAADDQVILHEISHMWSGPFDNRWLTEGIAEYTSLKAAGMIGIPGFEAWADPKQAPQATSRHWNMSEEIVTASAPSFDLDPWGGRFGYDPGDLFIDPRAGYSWGARFWQEIELRHGTEPFKKVMSAIQWKVQEGTIDSEAVMDLLEDEGGVKADDLFMSYVFPDDKHVVLHERRNVRDRLDQLTLAAEESAPELDTAVYPPIVQAIRDWRFEAALASIEELQVSLDAYLVIQDDVQGLRQDAEAVGLSYPFPWEEGRLTWQINTEIVDEMDGAYEAIDAYVEAKAVVEEPRGFFQKVGLLGKDDRAELNEAAGHFAWARFGESVESSEAAKKLIAGSHSDGVTYTIVLALVAGSMAVFVAVVYVISRQQEASAAAGSEAGS